MSRDVPVSVVVMTKNEERDLPAALASASLFAEVFVVDSGSVDRTTAIAHEHGAIVVSFEWNGRYPKKKQWCLDNLPFSHDWVLYLDADEEVSPELGSELQKLFSDGPDRSGYFVGLDYRFLGRVLRHGQRVYKLALLDRRHARFLDRDDLDAVNMWEVEGHYQPHVDGRVGVLTGRVLHDDHDSLFEYFARHNRYSDWEAVRLRNGRFASREEAQPPGRGTLKRVFAALPGKPILFFVYAYVLRGGFLDGRAGLHYAVAKSFYYWQVGVKARQMAASSSPTRDDLHQLAASDTQS